MELESGVSMKKDREDGSLHRATPRVRALLLTHPESKIEGQSDGPKVGSSEGQSVARCQVPDVCHRAHYRREGA